MSKVTIFGCTPMGEGIAGALAHSNSVSEVVIYDDSPDKADRLKGVVLDFNHGQLFHSTTVMAAGSIVDTAFSDIVIVTFNMPLKSSATPEEQRQGLVDLKAYFLKITPIIAKLSKHANVLNVTYPMDAATHLLADMLKFPQGRVFGSGTWNDTCRFTTMVARELGVRPANVHMMIVGEHNGVEVPMIETATCGGSKLTKRMKREHLQDLQKTTAKAAEEVIELRGASYQAISLTVRHIVKTITKDARQIVPLSVNVRGQLKGVDEDTYLSVPVLLGREGVKGYWHMELDKAEMDQLLKAATSVRKSYFFAKHADDDDFVAKANANGIVAGS